MTTYEVENMKKVKLKLLLGIFIAGSINTGIAMESKSARDNKELVQQENKEQEDRVYFNSSLLEIIPAMKTFGYEAELVSVDAEVTDDDGEPIIKDGKVMTELKSAIKFSKNGVHMATFPLDKSVPSDHNLWEWAGCTNYKSKVVYTETSLPESDTEEALRKEFYITLCGLHNHMRKDNKDKVLMNKTPLFTTYNNDLTKAIELMQQLLSYPEGNMLIYSIFLNRSHYSYSIMNDYCNKVTKNIDEIFKECAISPLSYDTFLYRFLDHFDTVIESENDDRDIALLLTFDTKNKQGYCKSKNSININEKQSEKSTGKFYEDSDNRIQTNKLDNLAVTLFHELCHFLNSSGENWVRYSEEYLNGRNKQEFDVIGSGELIVKYWEELYGKRETYSKNLIHVLFNDLFRYYSNNCLIGDIWEILATNWNNLGKNYYGNHLYENLLQYRILKKIRDSHADWHEHYETQRSILSKSLSNNYNYDRFLEQRIKLQYDRFKGNNKNTNQSNRFLKFNEKILPFEIKQNVLKINAPGHSYSIKNPLEEVSVAYIDNLIKHIPYDMEEIVINGLLHAHSMIDEFYSIVKKKYKTICKRSELIDLIDIVLIEHVSLMQKIEMINKQIAEIDEKKIKVLNEKAEHEKQITEDSEKLEKLNDELNKLDARKRYEINSRFDLLADVANGAKRYINKIKSENHYSMNIHRIPYESKLK